MSFISQSEKTRSRDPDTSVLIFLDSVNLYGMCVHQDQEEQRRRSERRDRVLIKLKTSTTGWQSTMAEVVYVAATRLVCQGREYKRVGYDQGVH